MLAELPEVAADAGPSAIVVALLLYLARGVPRFLDAATGLLQRLSVVVSRGSRVLLLFERKLEAETGAAHESDERLVYLAAADDATDEEIERVLMDLDPGETMPRRIAANGKRLYEAATRVAKRQREGSGPRRAAR